MKAILFDVRRCKGCMKCVEACCVKNEITEEGSKACFTRDRLSSRRLTTRLPVPHTSRRRDEACIFHSQSAQRQALRLGPASSLPGAVWIVQTHSHLGDPRAEGPRSCR